jgi:hypothetical protein
MKSQYRSPLTLIVCTLAVAACSGDSNDRAADASPDATQVADATAPPDGRAPDAGPADAAPDANLPDADPPDANLPDAGLDCALDLPCPQPSNDRFMLCGRVLDVATSRPELGRFDVRFHDALTLARFPGSDPEFEVTTDECGRFVSRDGSHDGASFANSLGVAVVVDDASSFPGPTDLRLPTVIFRRATAGGSAAGVRAYATRKDTEAAWSSGVTGDSFIQRGIQLSIFIDSSKPAVPPYPGAPVAGVRPTVGSGLSSSQDFYFGDTDVLARASLDSAGIQASTGPDGSAIVILVPSTNTFSGSPAPPGCSWPELIGKTFPGKVLVQEFISTCP